MKSKLQSYRRIVADNTAKEEQLQKIIKEGGGQGISQENSQAVSPLLSPAAEYTPNLTQESPGTGFSIKEKKPSGRFNPTDFFGLAAGGGM